MKKYKRKIFILVFVLASIIMLECIRYYKAQDIEMTQNVKTTFQHIIVNEQKSNTIVLFPDKDVEAKAYVNFAQKLSIAFDAKVYITKYLFYEPSLYFDFTKFKNDTLAIAHGEGSYALYKASFSKAIFLASIPYKKMPQETQILAIQSELDHVLDPETYFSHTSNFNENTTFKILNGANHSFYGNYGLVKNDIPGLLKVEQQQENTIEEIKKWLNS